MNKETIETDIDNDRKSYITNIYFLLKCIDGLNLKRLLMLRSFVNFKKLIHMKLYSLLVLNKIQNHKKKHFKVLKTNKLVLFSKRYIVM